ncbi:MAG: pyridoxal 5'-phosphate synthase glutaminase subunit PdxT [Clostridiales bacterium]|nr:pyridoxal 5'-phosphate synthase glutaminase subunit PdxT [Clostridiales bacterium]
MTAAVLAVQGAFIEHEHMLARLGVDCIELREKSDLQKHYDGIVLPGGESTVQGKLLKELDMYDTLREQIEGQMPVLATCAGLILLAKDIVNDDRTCFCTLPVAVRRNAYGRQLGSFYTEAEMKGIGEVPMTFIRAPYIDSVDEDAGVEVLAEIDGNIVAVKYKHQLAMAFHPELNSDERIHKMFVEMMQAAQ